MRNGLRRLGPRLALGALLAVVAFGVYAATLPAANAVVIAGPSVCSYYSNASYHHVVGARGTGCCGETISWGVTTPYVKCQRLYCLAVPCPF